MGDGRNCWAWLGYPLISLYDLRESPQIFPRSPTVTASIVSLTLSVHLVTTHASPGVRQVRYARLLFLRVSRHLPQDQWSVRNSSRPSKPATLTTGASGREDATTTRTS